VREFQVVSSGWSVDAGRNMWRLPASATLDLRLLKYFNIQPHGKLDFVIECFTC
jgi:hypothetical protein